MTTHLGEVLSILGAILSFSSWSEDKLKPA